ncbi:Citrate lyase alpha chain [Paraburkholderia piptadeniae]|uniref:Citrate lyase alpha chain n=1 Tax=Paraburkholderia piptadeniae TaxID=1701573 RepID=A0A1N7SU44_9BURK|nr:Citrate lyase alpha chain [Paraburkholderia piptadeniae]
MSRPPSPCAPHCLHCESLYRSVRRRTEGRAVGGCPQKSWRIVKTANGREIPASIPGYGIVSPYVGPATTRTFVTRATRQVHPVGHGRSKRLEDISAAIDACELKSGDTISFHHHLRNGDQVLNMVLAVAARRGIKDLTIATSSIFGVHAPLVEHIRNGVVARILTAYMSGPVADAVSSGLLSNPVVFQTHGGRARAIESGELHIDVAFIAAPAADPYGNLNGVDGPAACGPLGYAMVDAQYADRVVAVTDYLQPYPLCPVDIFQDQVDFVVVVDSIGDPAGILSGTTKPTTEPVGLQIAQSAARLIEASGLLEHGFSFQTGAGGVSIAVAEYVKGLMQRNQVQGSFAAGGVTGALVEMLELGLFRTIFDVQCFDLRAVESYRRDFRHQAMSASMYANPHSRGAVVNQLDVMILGASEVDVDFNVNVTTGSSGMILGGSGGHADTAAGAKLAIVTTRLSSRAGAKVVGKVDCLTTPGETIDAVVTEVGISVNPGRTDLIDRFHAAGIELMQIDEMLCAARALAGEPTSRVQGAEVVGVVEYRDGSVIDLIRASR